MLVNDESAMDALRRRAVDLHNGTRVGGCYADR